MQQVVQYLKLLTNNSQILNAISVDIHGNFCKLQTLCNMLDSRKINALSIGVSVEDILEQFFWGLIINILNSIHTS